MVGVRVAACAIVVGLTTIWVVGVNVKVGDSVTVGAADVAVGGSTVAVIAAVAARGGVAVGVGVEAAPQPATNVASNPNTMSTLILLFMEAFPPI